LEANSEEVARDYATARERGDFDIAAVIVGEACALIDDIPTAGEIVERPPTICRLTVRDFFEATKMPALADRLSGKLPDWVVLAKLFGEAGLTDRYGNPPKAERARKTWQRVRNEVKSARGNGPDQGAFPSVSKPGPDQGRSHSVTEPSDPSVEPTDEEPANDLPPRFTFRLSKPR
jgi:hypothetical protein